MELRVLRYFLVTAREQNITRAAAILNITQPTLSRQLMQLEEELGKTLFLRGKGQITLTDEGMLLRRRAQELLDLADKTEKEVRDTSVELSGDIYIGAAETETFHFVSTVMHAFSKQHPQVKYHLYSGNADDIIDKINCGLLDLALLMDPISIESFDYIRLPQKDVWGILLPSDDPLAKKTSIQPSDLQGKNLLLSTRALVQSEIEHWFRNQLEESQIKATFNLIYNASLLVEDGFGYAVTIKGLLPDHGEHSLCFRPFDPKLETGSRIVWKKQQFSSSAASALIEALQKAYT